MSAFEPELLRLVRVDQLIDNVAGSEEVACMVIAEFLLHVDAQLADISAGFERNDLPDAASAAHRFKGSLAAVYAASSALSRAHAIDVAARHRDVATAQRELTELVVQVREITQALRRWCEQRKGSAA